MSNTAGATNQVTVTNEAELGYDPWNFDDIPLPAPKSVAGLEDMVGLHKQVQVGSRTYFIRPPKIRETMHIRNVLTEFEGKRLQLFVRLEKLEAERHKALTEEQMAGVLEQAQTLSRELRNYSELHALVLCARHILYDAAGTPCTAEEIAEDWSEEELDALVQAQAKIKILPTLTEEDSPPQ